VVFLKKGAFLEDLETEQSTGADISEVVSAVPEENLRERRYLWTARAFAIVFVFSACSSLILLFSLFSLVPLVRVQPFYLTFQNKNEQIVSVQKLNASRESLNFITESLIRQYIITRHTIVLDIDQMLQRWGEQGPIRWMSTNGVFSEFVNTTTMAFKRVREEGLTRDINILSVILLKTDPKDGDIWKAEIETSDMHPEVAQPVVTPWIVQLRVAYLPKKGEWSTRLKNPMGFTVKQYSIFPKQTETGSE